MRVERHFVQNSSIRFYCRSRIKSRFRWSSPAGVNGQRNTGQVERVRPPSVMVLTIEFIHLFVSHRINEFPYPLMLVE